MYSPKRVLNVVSTVINDPNRKSLHTMLLEVIQLSLRDRALPSHYYHYSLYRRDAAIAAYVGHRNIKKAKARMRDPLWEFVINHKVLFDIFFRQQLDVRLPKLLGHSRRNQFVLGGEAVRVSDRSQLLHALELLATSSPTASVFAKPTSGTCGGMGCFRFDLSSAHEVCTRRGLELLSDDFLYQEAIVQHPKMAELHPSSVNTVRVDTYRTDQGEVAVMSAFVRMGRNRSCVDNASTGGCFVGVNLEEGTLMQRGFTKPKDGQGFSIVERHPDSGMVFRGFAIPFFSEALYVAKRAAELAPLTAVGWDLAIGLDEPILVEGNAPYDMAFSEIAYGGYWKNPVFRRLVADHAPHMSRIGMRFDGICPGEVRQAIDA
jgi:hypothetical protein